MPRRPRKDVFIPEEVNVYHCFNRTVRRSFLHGLDPLTGVDHSYRREYFRTKMISLSTLLSVEVLAFAIQSNHWHCVLRNRPDLVERMSNREVAIRWLSVTYRKKTKKNPTGRPTEAEINKLLNNAKQLAEVRGRLSNISWFVRLMCQPIARQCNIEDGCSGKFFEERFKMNRLDDEADVLACMAYVDLNPIMAGVTSELNDPAWQVSIGERLRTLEDDEQKVNPESWLAPLELDEEVNRKPVVVANDLTTDELEKYRQEQAKKRLGCLPMTLEAYAQLLWQLAMEARPELQQSKSLREADVRAVPKLRDQVIDLEKLRATLAEIGQRCNAELGEHACNAIRAKLAAEAARLESQQSESQATQV